MDLIKRSEAIEAVNKALDKETILQRFVRKIAIDAIKEMPSAQPDVIHCKDCEWWTKQDKSLQGRCELMQMYPTGEWFCGNAQKRVKDGRKNQNE